MAVSYDSVGLKSVLKEVYRDLEHDVYYDPATETLTRKEKKMNGVKRYFAKYEDLFMTIGIIVLLDHFVFKGLFRERLKTLVETALSKTEKKLLEEK